MVEPVITVFGVGIGMWAIVAFVIDWIIRIVAIIVVPRNRRPTAATAWLLAIFFIPSVGVVLFLLIGNPKLPRARRRRQDEINRAIADAVETMPAQKLQAGAPKWLKSLVRMNRNLGSFPVLGGNEASLHGEYDEAIHAMADAVRGAERWAHVEFYNLSLDATTEVFFDAMASAVARGVHVRVLYDHVASFRAKGYRGMVRRLQDIGADAHRMLPLDPLKWKWQRPDLRNHRKLVVVDGLVAFLGSQNMVDRSYNKASNLRRGLKWKELVGEFRGPIVGAVNAIFLSDWYSETGELISTEIDVTDPDPESGDLDCQMVPSGPGFEQENNLKMFLGLVYGAQRRLVITSPYFVPDESLLVAVTSAVERGVQVELFVSEIGDQPIVYHAQRSYYEALLRAGVRIWLYKAPYILHSKHFTVDEEIAVIGSSNMDMRSFGLNLEVSLLVRGRDFVEQMRDIEAGYRASSRELTLEEWMKQPLRSTVLDNLARLTSALQ